ncbi:hypothetical protein BGY98DRAFT_1104453 [Russula aff. rugulosa BPL654]|nr:hypothetical protein BGY98DRAFT_1104453 [Russula aff. rugulosa BPL654]
MSRSGELGIDADFSKVNIVKGANFSLEFLKLNPNATLPTLPAPPARQLHVCYRACRRTTESETVTSAKDPSAFFLFI